MRRASLSLLAGLALAGCVETTPPYPAGSGPSPVPSAAPSSGGPSRAGSVSVSDFAAVVSRIEPVAEQECRTRARGANCDFQFVVDRDPSAPSNAYQSLGPDGRPVLTVNAALIADVYNTDELAFVLGHEAAHHISGHIARTQETAMTGALLGGVLIAAIGGDPNSVRTAQDIGASVGARTYSKSYELEADQLGTIIAYRAGYDPLRGAEFFTRIPDPGDRFLGSHPPNTQRIETVRRTMSTL
ncbi:M48 family metallopeptidase [Celeribacter indicus]|uniref:M48 family peptidase n=1 Tax=Celeribacter indicus TaxID=1208324 RepID=A0A0B5E7X7_9RHOB|nr:M48 family metallopeptidase [Celeribacter indicus]AJE48402.1 M48 family peptidase [Celeribacter indicus]SDX58462.1 Peptidase family M48 [Celeribacter indicus]